MGTDADAETRAALDAAIGAMVAPFAQDGGFVHRDYFPANLMRLPGRDGQRRTGLLDFQDAARGCAAYDLVSLVEDARRDVPAAIRDSAVARYLDAQPGIERDRFHAALAACAAQRHLRVAALWVRLARRDGKPRYLVHGPRCWRLLDRALQHPATRPLRDFLDARVPAALRRNPLVLTEPA
jgi:N-acetylmuramate 1-kinase